jgi:hypothetical protein
MTGPDPDDVDAQCSAKGCRRPAEFALLWRNPRIHTADRIKQWLACAEHRESLSDFLARRDFPLRVVPVRDAEGAELNPPAG